MTDPELVAVFRRELAEALDGLAQIVEALYAEDASAGREHLRDAYRIAHNIKGAARAAGAVEVEELTHALEDLLDHYLEHGHDHDGPVSQALSDQLLATVVLIEQITSGEVSRDAIEALLGALAELRAAAPETQPARGPAEGRDLGAPTAGDSRPAIPLTAAAVPEVGAGAGAQEEAVERGPASEAGAQEGASVRVDPRRLDRAMVHTGEFLAAAARRRARVQDADELIDELRAAIASLPVAERPRMLETLRRLEAHAQVERLDQLRFTRLIESFGDAMKRVRMFALAGLDKQWRAVLRSAADATGKRVRMKLELGAIELDKRVLDELRDPFVHLLRNAVDHGIEDPATRRARGKAEAGLITISATLVGARVRVEVCDDGGGLDREAIARRAADRGLAEADALARMTEAEVHELLFVPGFSTRAGVSRLSGRGIGLDVVRGRVEALSGAVEIGPAPGGVGTRVRLLVPTTLVSTNGLLARASDNVYALPLDHVVRTLRVPADELEQADGGAVLRVAEREPLRVRWLAALFGQRRVLDPAKLTIVVVSDGRARLGLVVSEVIGEAEFMARPLPWNLGEIPGVSGVMTRPDGGLAVVADVPHLIAHARQEPTTDHRALAVSVEQIPRILVVDDSLTSRTLERNILVAAGYEVALTCDGEEAWQHLQSQSVDLVVADIEMPRLDGIELTRRIRASASLGEIPIILVSSLDGPEDRAAGAAAGADEYVVKGSFDRRVLLEAVTRLI